MRVLNRQSERDEKWATSSDRQSYEHGIACVLVCAATLAGCEGTGTVTVPWFPKPNVKSIEFHPAYFCSGDEITVNWDTVDIDKIELLARNGRIILSTRSPSGTATTPDIGRGDLPLTVRGYVGDEDGEWPVEGLVNIDNPVWTADIPSTAESPVLDSARLEAAYSEQIELADGSIVEYMVYKVWMTYRGLYWRAGEYGTIPTLSEKAKIELIANHSGLRLAYSSYVAGAITLADNAEGVLDPSWPGKVAGFRGDYDQPVEQHVAMQYGEQTKPEEDWFRIDKFYQDAVGNVSLYVSCDL